MSEVARDLPRDDLFRLVVTMRVLTTDEGGRQGPIASGYRPDCWFGAYSDGERLLHGCIFFIRDALDAFEDEGTLWVPTGGSCTADALVRYASFVRPVVAVGGTFDVQEGSRVVARGVVDEVFDPGPEYDIG